MEARTSSILSAYSKPSNNYGNENIHDCSLTVMTILVVIILVVVIVIVVIIVKMTI